MGELLPKDCFRSVFDYSTFQEIKNVFEKSKAMLKANKDFDCLVNKRFTDFNNSNYDTW